MTVRNLIKAALKKLGYRETLLDSIIDEAQDGQQALDRVKQLHEDERKEYGLILSDCQMPVLDGYGACLQIRDYLRVKNLKQPFIVAITGNIEARQIEHAFDS